MAREGSSISDQVREAIDSSDMSRYRLCKEAELAEATMSRFMSGKGGLSMETLDRIGAILCLRIVAHSGIRQKRRQKRGESNGKHSK